MIRRIRTIARKLRGKKVPPEMPIARINALRTLTSYPEWKSFQALLEQLVEHHAESLLTTNDASTLHYLRGVIVGLRESTLYAERIATTKEHEHRDTAAARAARRAASLYATAAWPGDTK